MMRSILAVVFLLSITGLGYSNNNYFLPGDAFFHVTLTAQTLKDLNAKGPPYVVDYSLQDTFPLTFSGYAGYRGSVRQVAHIK